MEKVSETPVAQTGLNAATGSPRDCGPMPPSTVGMHELVAASSPFPPPELIPWLKSLSPEDHQAFVDLYPDNATAWSKMAVILGMEDEVADVDLPEDQALATALLSLPVTDIHGICRRHPFEVMAAAEVAWLHLMDGDPAHARCISEICLAPELLAAIDWRNGAGRGLRAAWLPTFVQQL